MIDKAPSDEAVEALERSGAWNVAVLAAAMECYSTREWVGLGDEQQGEECATAESMLRAALPHLLADERISTNMTMGEMLDKIKRLEALLEEEREKADDEYYEAVETVTKRAMKAEAALLEARELILQAAKNMEWHANELKTTSDEREQEIRRSLLADAKNLREARSSLGSPEEADRG